MTWLAGLDGCRGGWVVAWVRPQGAELRLQILPHFTGLAAVQEAPAVIAVDIPIGLPERCGAGGRAAEATVRPLLGARQSAVFSVPSRAAVYAQTYGEACAAALASSDPPRKVSRQLFNIAPKIREVDAALRADAAMARRTFEVHPELAFWRLNGDRSLGEPKKVKSRPHAPGLALRRALLAAQSLHPPEDAPPGAGADDVLDALACAAVARRIHAGTATPFPAPPPRDAFGLPIAIWA